MERIVFFIALGIGALYFILKRLPVKIHERILEELKSLFHTLLIVSMLMYFVIQAFKIPSGSMENTFLIKDHLFACKFIYGWYIPLAGKYIKFSTPKRGDIIIFKYPLNTKKDFIKRCIGLPGDTLEIKDQTVFIDGKPLQETYTVFKDGIILPRELNVKDNFGPIEIPPDSFFVMGDNRDRSMDSRFWGCLERKYLRGKALFKYWPPKRIGICRHVRPEFVVQ